jgi:hypothetical protein
MSQTLLVNKEDFAEVALVNIKEDALDDGCIRLKLGPWALTANNITYMLTGDQIGYWHYFNPTDYGIQMDESDGINWGRMPVWGYGEVIESRCADVKVGQRVYGFLPISDSFDMRPVKLTPHGFQDGMEHRTKLHSLYNGLTFTDKDPSFGVHEDLQPVLRPLFTTSFLIDDFLAEKDFFDAEQVLILSASSKTALGTAFCLKQRGAIPTVGLTSERNKEFVDGTGFYANTYSYDAITDMNPDVKTVIVDMAGNGDVMETVLDHFEENITYICRVGISHWDAKPNVSTKGKTPSGFFFAPDQAKARIAEWGGTGFNQRLGARWLPFLDSASDWLSVEKQSGVEPLLKTYKEMLDGTATPDKGYLFSL